MLKPGEMIRKLREEKGWSQQRLSEEIHMTQHTISQWENGKRIPDAETYQRVLAILNPTDSEGDHVLTEASYRVESSDYEGKEPQFSFELTDKVFQGHSVYKVVIERNGKALILPEFVFGYGSGGDEDKQEDVLRSFAFDYALYEDCPTLTDFILKRGIETLTKEDTHEFENFNHDMACLFELFSAKELAEIDY